MAQIRLTVAYNPPPDAEEFFRRYRDEHVPLVADIPGVLSFEWSKVTGTASGEPSRYALLASLTFDSMESFGAGMGSPAGKAAGAHAAGIALNGADTFISEIVGS